MQSRNNNCNNVFCTDRDFLSGDQASLYQRLLANSQQLDSQTNTLGAELEMGHLLHSIESLGSKTKSLNSNLKTKDQGRLSCDPVSVGTSHMSLQLLQSPFLSHDTYANETIHSKASRPRLPQAPAPNQKKNNQSQIETPSGSFDVNYQGSISSSHLNDAMRSVNKGLKQKRGRHQSRQSQQDKDKVNDPKIIVAGKQSQSLGSDRSSLDRTHSHSFQHAQD